MYGGERRDRNLGRVPGLGRAGMQTSTTSFARMAALVIFALFAGAVLAFVPDAGAAVLA